ncbi:MAG TPA: 2-amino-4-hydroxy-6-hydroxymethyldihydropteridine diphosphokinase [Lentisphaeria bacterium]|nr:MAG: 2-amino-4-hydroxy-6-hydroxymethyldihydropteridine diphosphokinase [Lentisphaerae bacterium GWF2_49_21]HBC87704.1 2-amino-4-hydroxy-6-hydroxymethyldihydropteridine diphosphokinase [Lentisphaeria bacterium]
MDKTDQIEVALSLGGNMGDVPGTFKKALGKLKSGGLSSICISSLYRTPPVGCRPGTAEFINAAVTGKWSGSIKSLHRLCKKIEVEAGRPEKHVKFSSRPLDIDIVFFGDMIYSDEKLTIPHKEARKRVFVLLPLGEIAGERIFPGLGLSVRNLLVKSRNRPAFKTISKTRFPLFKK